MKHITCLLIAFLVVNSCSRNPVTGKRELILMSKSQEINMGKQYDPEIIKMYGLYEDQGLSSLLTSKGKAMANISHRPALDYQFRLLDSPVVNAFAVPGGYVYFTRGIMAHFNNEAEMAGVLGHEIGHITARHSAKQYSRQTLMQALMIGGLIFSPEFRNFADLANQGVGLLFLRFSRAHERESDKLGVQYSSELGYDAHEMAGFFSTLERLSGQAGGSLPQFLSTHPDPGGRKDNVNNYVDELIANGEIDGNNLMVKRNEYLSKIEGLLYGVDPKQGFVENSKFYHPELKFVFDIPNGWRTNNTPSQVQLSPQNGKAVILFELEAGNNLASAADAVIDRNKIDVIERENVSVNGFPAVAILGEVNQTSQSGAPTATLRVMTYLIKYGNFIYKVVGLSEKADFNGYFNNFKNTATSFKELTDQSKINKKPERIKIVTATGSTNLRSVLTQNGIPSERLNEFAILNGMNLNDSVPAGMKVKVFELRS